MRASTCTLILRLETGQAVKGDIAVELIDSTNICFGNAACDEVQRQPYIIIAMRRDADEVRQEARANGISASDAEAIRPVTAANTIVTAPRATATA